MIFLRIGKTSPQTVAVESVDRRSPILPCVGNTGRTGETLIVIEEDPVLPNVIELIAIEQKLRGADVRTARPSVGRVQVGGESAFVISAVLISVYRIQRARK
jgi:hypothetical protein